MSESLYQIIKNALLGDPEICSVIGGDGAQRAYALRVPDSVETPYPCITIQTISDVPSQTIDGNICGLSNARIRVNCWSPNFSDAYNLRKRAMHAVTRASSQLATFKPENAADDWQDQIKLNHSYVDFMVLYREVVF